MSLFLLMATIVVTELGLFQRIFDTASHSASQWVICLVVASGIVWVLEVVKRVRRLRPASASPAADATTRRTSWT
jgi:hypothetical protein